MFNFIPLLEPSIALYQIYEPNQSVSFGRLFRLGRVGNWIFFPYAALSAEKNSADVKTKQLLLEAKDKAQSVTEEAVKKSSANSGQRQTGGKKLPYSDAQAGRKNFTKRRKLGKTEARDRKIQYGNTRKH